VGISNFRSKRNSVFHPLAKCTFYPLVISIFYPLRNSVYHFHWWENDGSENFTEHTIAGSYDGPNCVYAEDMDGDGDIDVLGAAGYIDDEINWWEIFY
jgi:hypothetical protein